MPEASASVAASATPARDEAPMMRAKAVSVKLGKPPLAVYSFDVTLRNPSPEARYLVLPRVFPYDGKTEPRPGASPETEISIRSSEAHPRIVVVSGLSSAFYAVRLQPRGQVTLLGLGIEAWWSERHDDADLEVWLAREIRVGDGALSSLFSIDLASEPGQTDVVSMKGSRDGIWDAPDSKSQPVTFDVEQRAHELVSLRGLPIH